MTTNELDPGLWGQAITYVWMTLIAFWGGTVNYIGRIKSGEVKRFSFFEWVGELVISGFSGVLTYWICTSMGVADLMTAAAVGIAGHAGGRTVALLERSFGKKLDSLIGREQGK